MLITNLEGDDLEVLASLSLPLLENRAHEGDLSVLVPSFSSKMWLRRLIASRSTVSGSGVYPINLSVLTMEEFGVEYGLAALLKQGRIRCPRRVIAAVVASDQFQRKRAIDPNVLSNLVHSVERLALLRDGDLDLLVEVGGSKELIELAEKVGELRDGRYFHLRTLLECAVSSVASNSTSVKELVVFAPQLFDESLKVFWEVLGEQSAEVTVESVNPKVSLGRCSDNEEVSFVDTDRKCNKLQIVGARKILDELRSAVTFMISHIDAGHSPSKMGLFFAQPSLYLPYWEILRSEMATKKESSGSYDGDDMSSPDSLESLFNAYQSVVIKQLPVGQLLHSLLLWMDSDFGRLDFIDRLPGVLAQIENGKDESKRKSFEYWDLITTEANIYKGRQEWLARLEDLKESWTSATHSVYLAGRTLTQLEMQEVLEQLCDLQDFVHRCFVFHDQVQGGTFASMAKAVIEYLIGILGSLKASTVQQAEANGLDEFVTFSNQMSELDDLDIPPSFEKFKLLLENFLEQSVKTSTQSRQLVTVAPLMSVVGSTYDYVAVIGVNDQLTSLGGGFSSSFDDSSIATLGLPLFTSKEFGERVLAHLVALIRSSKAIMITFDRSKVGAKGEVSESVSQLLDVTDDRYEIVNLDSSSTKLPVYAGTLRQPLSVKELLLLIDGVSKKEGSISTIDVSTEVEPYLARAQEIQRRFKAHDLLEHLDLEFVDLVSLSKNADIENFPIREGILRLAPTQLESYVKCPYGFFANSILGISIPERPEETLYMSPRTMGELIHAVMEEVLRQPFANSGGVSLDSEPEALFYIADQTLNSKFSELSQKGHAGRRAFESANLAKARAHVRRLLKTFISHVPLSAATGLATEVRFDGIELNRGYLKTKGEVPVAFRGKMDLLVTLGINSNVEVLVVDYKTGSMQSYKDLSEKDPTARGSKFQMFIYALAATKLAEVPIEAVAAKYWFSSVSVGQREISMNFTVESENTAQSEAEKVIGLILSGVFAGRSPSASNRHISCEYCNPKGVRNPYLEREWLLQLSNLLNASIAVPDVWLDNVKAVAQQKGE